MPLCKPGIAIGSVFVLTLVMGDFITVRLMGGGQRASVGLMISNQISLLQYPAACANAVVLLGVTHDDGPEQAAWMARTRAGRPRGLTIT